LPAPSGNSSQRLLSIISFLAISLATATRYVSQSVALAQPDVGVPVRGDAGTSSDGTQPVSAAGSGLVCLTPYSLDPEHRKTAVYPEIQASRRTATWSYWTECQKCPDAWSKCEPCDPASMTSATLAVLQDLHLRRTCSSKVVDLLATLRLPSHPRRDAVWVALADFYYFDCDRPTLAAANYQRLIRDDADPQIAGHAALALGEILFAKGDWSGAEEQFRRSTKLATGAQALCATYRQACALERLGHLRLAEKRLHSCASVKGTDQLSASLARTCAAEESRLHP
jgi:Tetratricopeptide repeat